MSIHPQHAPDGWRIRKLCELGELVGGATPSTTEDRFFGGDIVWLAPSDLTPLSDAEIYISNSATKLTAAGFKSCSTKMIPEGAICMSSRATLGECAIAAAPLCTNQGFISIVCNPEIDNRFLFYWVKQNASYISRFSAGTTFLEIPRRTFGRLRVCLPASKQEQTRIADLINAVDRSLAATQASIAAAQKLKRGLMQNLLTGKLKPDGTWRRDDEFDIDPKFGRVPKGWQLVPVKDATENLDSKRKPVKSEDRAFIQGTYPYYGASGIVDYVNDYIYDGEYILFGEDGENLLSRKVPLAFIVRGKFWVNNHAHVLQARKGYDIEFICDQLESNDYRRFVIGSAQPKINQAQLAKVRMCAPDYEQQVEISKVIGTAKKVVRDKEGKLIILQKLKKSLMQNLLTGKVRIPPELKIE